MTLFERIDGDIKDAMKAKNEAVLSTLRMVKTAMKNKQIDLGHPLSDDEAAGVMRTMAKQYKDALADFAAAGRTDLADRQKAEIELIEKYLPAQLTEAQVEDIAKAVIAELGATAKDMGRVMGAVMKKAEGNADGNAVKSVVQRLLAS